MASVNRYRFPMAIRLLKPEVVEKIAAGEVLERPANLVKELLENSLDAGATQIEVEVDQGGRWIQVTDDGSGIKKEELPLALLRHATSKIQESEDIWGVETFGFRGEALASAAAVSKLTLISKHKSLNEAFQLTANFGTLTDVIPAGLESYGSVIQVESLFENVPVRLKFLKSENAELVQIKKVVKALALANEKVSFRLRSKSKTQVFLPKTESKLERAKQVLESKELFIGEASRDGIHVTAAFTSPHEVQASTQNMWFFVQNRYVQDRSMQAAVMEAYRNLLMHGEYPSCAIWVTAEPEEVDVNIHPTKSQVKFRDSSLVFRAVQAAIREVLEKAPWLKQDQQRSIPVISKQALQETLSMSGSGFDQVHFSQKSFDNLSVMEVLQKYSPSAPEMASQITIQMSGKELSRADSKWEASHYWSKLQVLGQTNLTYILAQSQRALVLVDQHAAHERVNFEKLMNSFKNQKLESQEFLIPLQIELQEDQVEALLQVSGEFEKMGLVLERSGPNHIAVMSAPSILSEKSLQLTLTKFAKEVLENGASFAFDKAVSDLCASFACHSSVRAGQALSFEEMQALLKSMDEYPLSSFCPHGRPVYVEFPFHELDKKFGRII